MKGFSSVKLTLCFDVLFTKWCNVISPGEQCLLATVCCKVLVEGYCHSSSVYIPWLLAWNAQCSCANTSSNKDFKFGHLAHTFWMPRWEWTIHHPVFLQCSELGEDTYYGGHNLIKNQFNSLSAEWFIMTLYLHRYNMLEMQLWKDIFPDLKELCI